MEEPVRPYCHVLPPDTQSVRAVGIVEEADMIFPAAAVKSKVKGLPDRVISHSLNGFRTSTVGSTSYFQVK